MDVLNKLRSTVSNTITNTVNSTAYGLSQLSSVLPGNPVTREFEATAHIASAGPGLLWKIYSGYKKSTHQEAAIFVFDKRALERFTKNERENILEVLKKGISQLTKLKHPQILTVQHPLEESRDSLVFATEPVIGSLANVLGNVENVSQPIPKVLKEFNLHDVEIRYGLFQLGEGLAFLHGAVKLLHRNICPESIVINKNGAWKIFGFDFCILNQSPLNKEPSWSFIENVTIPMILQPKLNFQAPEYTVAKMCYPATDIYALGMLAYVIYLSDNKSIHEIQDDVLNLNFVHIPKGFIDTIKLMLSNNPQLRPDAHQFIQIEYFLDNGMKTLNYLDKLFQWDNLQKSQFYKGLPQVIKQLPHRVILHRVLPCLYKEFVNTPMIPFVLPSIFQALENCNAEDFNNDVLPNLKPVFAMEEPVQIGLVFMQHIDLLLKLCSPTVTNSDIVPMFTRALDSNVEHLQQLCLAALPSIAAVIEGPSMNNIFLRIKKICISPGTNSSLSLRVNCLMCVAKLLEHLDRWIVTDQVLPFLQEIPHRGDPAILMVIIGIHHKVLTHNKLGINKETLASKVLPFILPLSIEQRLTLSQFDTVISLINDMLSQITHEHRETLRQLDSMRQESQQPDEILHETTNPVNILYSESHSNTSAVNLLSQTLTENKVTISKDKSLQQQRIQYQPQTSLRSIQPKDLTSTFLQNNLNQLDTSLKQENKYRGFQMNNSNSNASSWNEKEIHQQSKCYEPNNSFSRITLPTNQNLNFTTNIRSFDVATDHSGIFQSEVRHLMETTKNKSVKSQLINEQQSPTTLSSQEIIDFLS